MASIYRYDFTHYTHIGEFPIRIPPGRRAVVFNCLPTSMVGVVGRRFANDPPNQSMSPEYVSLSLSVLPVIIDGEHTDVLVATPTAIHLLSQSRDFVHVPCGITIPNSDLPLYDYIEDLLIDLSRHQDAQRDEYLGAVRRYNEGPINVRSVSFVAEAGTAMLDNAATSDTPAVQPVATKAPPTRLDTRRKITLRSVP